MSRTTVVYLSGFGRSGSTLVERMLGAAPAWVNVGELVDLARSVARTDELCGCGEPFSRCPVWTRVGEVAFGGWTDDVLDRLARLQRSAARQRHLPGLLAPRRPRVRCAVELRKAYAAVYRAVAEVTGSAVVVDASKGPALGAALAGAPGVDLRMLNVVRDPRAVAWSWRRHVDRPHATSGTDEMWRIPVHRSAAQWSALQLEVEAIAYAGRVPVARIRYEDLVADPVADAGRPRRQRWACRWVRGRPAGGRRRAGGARPSHGLSGNPGRFRSGPCRCSATTRWATEMPASSPRARHGAHPPPARTYRYPPATATTVPAVPLAERPSRSSS